MNVSEMAELVAPCGLYCGNCYKFKKGKCGGCAKNEKASWCKIRTCSDRCGETCAGCKTHKEVDDCSYFNNIFARIFSFIFRSDRKASLKRIVEVGEKQYAKEMDEKGKMVFEK